MTKRTLAVLAAVLVGTFLLSGACSSSEEGTTGDKADDTTAPAGDDTPPVDEVPLPEAGDDEATSAFCVQLNAFNDAMLAEPLDVPVANAALDAMAGAAPEELAGQIGVFVESAKFLAAAEGTSAVPPETFDGEVISLVATYGIEHCGMKAGV